MGAHNDWVDRIFCYEWVQIGAGGNARQALSIRRLLYICCYVKERKNQELVSNLAIIIIIFQVNNKEAMTSDATTAIREPQSGISTQIQTPPL